MVNNSTDYYRQNRRDQRVVYRCPHCNYCTHNCRITLTNHINSKHKSEEARPFQCSECNRGFAQKAHLIRHLAVAHNISGDLRHSKTTTLLYIITPGNNTPRSNKTMARSEFYKENPVLKSRDIHNGKHEYMPGNILKNHDLHYDRRKGFVEFVTLALKKGYHISEKPEITVNL